MYDNILIPTDRSDPAAEATEHALELAAQYDATVHALYVVDSRMSPITPSMDESALRDLLQESPPTAAVADACRERSLSVRTALRAGVPHEVIADYVRENDIDLVVMGRHGRAGLSRRLLGSTASRVLRTVDRPVLTVCDREE
ncbi:universal stress protein [Haloplanus halobius]|uniref:universal stress protein n=1 Tax=Haloplanus halobius TaxID=2934938 RepID=UPI00200DF9E7|nr:universal stress protein [Haloplanus sp. XH21]